MTMSPDEGFAIRKRWLFLLIVALCGLTYFYKLGSPRICNIDEALYAETAREMLVTGDWMTPRYNGQNFFDKPALVYWLIAVSYRMFGVNEFAARLPNAIYTLMGLFVLFGIGKTLLGDETALIGTLVLGTALEHHGGAIYADSHTGLTFCVALSLLSFLKGYRGDRPRRVWFFLFYLSAAIGCLIKGPVALLLPALIVAVFLTIRRDWKAVKNVEASWGIPLVVALVLPWNILMLSLHGKSFIHGAWVYEDLSRYLQGRGKREFHQLFYYFYNFPGEFFPWGLFMIPALMRMPERLRKATEDERRTLKFLLSWFVATFVFFSLSGGQIAYYVALLNTAAALLVADFLMSVRLVPNRFFRGFTFGVTGFSFAVILLVVGALIFAVFPDVTLRERVLWLALWLVGIGLTFHWTQRDRVLRATTCLGLTTMAFYLFTSASLLPRLERLRPYPAIAKRIRREGGDQAQVVVYRIDKPAFIFYLQRNAEILDNPYTDAENRKQLVQYLSGHRQVFCLIDATDYTNLRDAIPATTQIIGQYPYMRSSESRIGTFLSKSRPSEPKDALLLVSNTGVRSL